MKHNFIHEDICISENLAFPRTTKKDVKCHMNQMAITLSLARSTLTASSYLILHLCEDLTVAEHYIAIPSTQHMH